MDRSRGRRVTIVAIAAVVAVACVALGVWQLQRLGERRARNTAIEARRGRAPVAIRSATAEPPPPYTPVRASGTFDPQGEVLVYGRSLEGLPGHWVVTPLVLEDGNAALVIRGWVPFDRQEAPVADAAPPNGSTTVRGFLRPDEGDGSTVPDADGVVGRVDVRGIGSALPYRVLVLPIQLTEQDPPQPSELPVRIGWPELSEGPHLSYAIQWFAFATIAVVGAIVLAGRERRDARSSA